MLHECIASAHKMNLYYIGVRRSTIVCRLNSNASFFFNGDANAYAISYSTQETLTCMFVY